MTRFLFNRPAAASFSAVALVLCFPFTGPVRVRAANEVGFVEKYALAADREEALRQLIPGTEDFYFYHALHWQNAGRRDSFREVLGQWAERTPDSAARRALEARQALLDYGADPEATLGFLKAKLGLALQHQREVPNEKPDLPVALEGELISESRFLALATQGVDHLDQMNEPAVARLVAAGHAFTSAQRRAALARLSHPDVAGLVALIAADLATPESRGFGEFPIHGALTLAQLDELSRLRAGSPAPGREADVLTRNELYVQAYLRKLRPGADDDATRDPAAREAWLERAWAFAAPLEGPFNSLKAHLLYQRLEHDRGRGVYDAARFLEYVKLPRNVFYINPVWRREQQVWNFPAELGVDFSAVTGRSAIGADDGLVRDYLLRLLATAPSPEGYAPYFEESWLKAVFAEARLTAGVDDPREAEKLASALSSEAYDALKRRVDLDFDLANPARLAPGDAVALDIWVKNAPQVTIKIFELNTAACYEASGQAIGTDIDLDGLVAATQRTMEVAAAPLRRVRHRLALPEIGAQRGVWVVELIGNGRSSRALLRKGQLHYLTRASSAGTALTVLDEAHQPLKSAYITMAGRRINADENAEMIVPFTAQPGPQALVLHDGTGFSSLETVTLAGESYQLAGGFHVEREQLLAGAQATLVVRPRLQLNGQPVSARLLEKPSLTLVSTDQDGIATTVTLPEFKLHDDRESTHVFQVPDRLASLKVELKAEVKSLSAATQVPLTAMWSWDLNGIDASDHITDLHLGRAADGWFIDERGKNGEGKPERAVHLQLWHRDYVQPVGVSLKTGDGGRLRLGLLPGISKMAATGPNGLTREWGLPVDAVVGPGNVHVAVGDVVRIPSLSPAAECSLLEVRGDGGPVADWSDRLVDADGFLEAKDLPPGDYQLHLRPEQRRVMLRVAKAQRVKDFLLSATRFLEAPTSRLLQVSGAAMEGDELVVRVANGGPLTRLHVTATRYAPAFPLAGLGALPSVEPLVGRPGDSLSQYVSGRQLGDEIRYILERLALKVMPGVMLPRPGLLLNPWAVRDTSTVKQEALVGDKFERLAEGETAAMSAPAAADAAAAMFDDARIPMPPATASLDFLAAAAPVHFNVPLGADGVARLPRAALGMASQVHIVALDVASSVTRTVVLPAQPVATRDLRLVAGLDPNGHFAQKDEVVVAEKEKPYVLTDALSTRFETYDHLGRVFTLLRTLSGNETLAEFSFILEWPTFDEAKKREHYSKHACHELNFFIARKDPAFFTAVIQPYLANKKDRTFLDEYLLEKDLSRFLEPWRYGRLNTLERILLARRLPDQQAAEVRALQDVLAMTPVNREEDRRRLETALQGFSLARSAGGMGGGAGKDQGELGDVKNKLAVMNGRMEARQLAAFSKRSAAEPGAPVVADFALQGLADKPDNAPAGAALPEDSAVDALALRDRDSRLGENAGGEAKEFGFSTRFNEDFLARQRGVNSVFFRALGVTQEWAENNYWKLLIAQQDASLVMPNRFWLDYAQWSGQGSFVSAHVAEAARTFSEMMLALAVLDLPFPSQAAEIKAAVSPEAVLTLTPSTPLIVFHQSVKPAPVDEAGAGLLVSQNFYRADDRYVPQPDGEKIDKFVSGEFLAGVRYGAQVVVTNPTSSTQKLDVLFQIPQGARPASGARVTRSVPLRLEPFRTHTMDVSFYFPQAGSFPHFPVHVARDGRVVAMAPAVTFKVVNELSVPDTTSWAYLSQHGTEAEVLAFMDASNVRTLDLDKVAWRLHGSAEFFRSVISRLSERRIWQPTLYAYGFVHNDATAIREFLRHEGNLLTEAGPWLRSPLVEINPVDRQVYEQLEYSPLVNARAHRLGPDRTILNDRFREHYQRLLSILAHKPALDDADHLAVTGYLLLQDRIEEALQAFAHVKKDAVQTSLQYDYTAAWLALAQGDAATARALAAARANEPVDHWRLKFAQMLAQLDEIDGKSTAVTTPDDRDQTQDALAAAQPGFDFKLEGARLTLETRNLAEVTVNYYLMDLEFLFSTNPFVGQDSSRFAQIVPNKSETIRPAQVKSSSQQISLPREFQNKNVLVEIVAAGQRSSQVVYANELKVILSENFGQVQVRHAGDDRPLPRTYVKVYAEVNGKPVFYKDGYTDLRGKFDYASLSTNDLNGATRFAVLILSDEHGAVVKEARPPRQ